MFIILVAFASVKMAFDSVPLALFSRASGLIGTEYTPLFLLIYTQLFCFILCVYYTTKQAKSPVFMRVYEQLSKLYFLHFSVCLWLLDTQSFHQPAVLLSSNAERFVLAARPLELTLFKSLVE